MNQPQNEKEKPSEVFQNQKLGLEQIRKKYLKIIEVAGVDAAITEIHREMGVLEPLVFESGFKTDRFEKLQFYRILAREVYNFKLAQDSKIYKK